MKRKRSNFSAASYMREHERSSAAVTNPDLSGAEAMKRWHSHRIIDDPDQQMMFGLTPTVTAEQARERAALFFNPRRGELVLSCPGCNELYAFDDERHPDQFQVPTDEVCRRCGVQQTRWTVSRYPGK